MSKEITSSSLSEQRMYELKQEAASYFARHNVSAQLEDILNSILHEKPNDVYGRLSRYFESLSTPVQISGLKANRIVDGGGKPALQCDVYCTVRNENKHVSCTSLSPSSELSLLYSPDTEEIKVTDNDIVTSCVTLIEDRISQTLRTTQVTDQKQIDDILRNWINQEELTFQNKELDATKDEDESPRTPTPSSGRKKKPPSGKGKGKAPDKPTIPFKPHDKRLLGCSAVGLVSIAALRAASGSLEKQPFDHLHTLSNSSITMRFPVPAIDVFNGGKSGPGKLNVAKGIFLISKPGKTMQKSVETLLNTFQQLGKMVKDQTTGISTGYQPAYDKIEQPLDLVGEAAATLGMTVGQDFYIGIDCAAHELFDYDKGKYEIATGALKSADEMVEYYKDITTRYPAIITLVNPLRKEDTEQWMKMCDFLSDKCFILGGNAFFGSCHSITPDIVQNKPSSGVALTTGGRVTISDMISIREHTQSRQRLIMLAAPMGDVCDTIFADLAVGLSVDIARFGAPCHGETTAKLNRLLEIEQYAQDQGTVFDYNAKKFAFPVIKCPSPAEGDAASNSAPSPDQRSKK